MDWDLDAVTAKWQEAWAAEKLQHAEPGDKPSYFIHFAYPGISGYLHVGHMRGFTYADVFGRYKRMTGHNVLYPAGFHASGIPAVAFAKEVERGEKTEYLRSNGFDGDLAELSDPRKVVDYFAHVYLHDYWQKFGFLIDERRVCTTIDDGYQQFIRWQFTRLQDKGYLVEKPHYAPFCPVAGPIAVDKSETDIKQGGGAEIMEFVALRFAMDDHGLDLEGPLMLPCATLRPETVFGVTNVWIHPDTDYELVRVWQDGAVADDDPSEVWLASEQGRKKLEWQCERAEALGIKVQGSHFVGRQARVPVTEKVVPIVQGTFVDPMIGTGVVMSVPAHAPFDFAAYTDAGLLERLGEPPQIVDIPGYEDLPARVANAKHGVQSQTDKDALEAATEEIYADEFNKGTLNDLCGDYAGKRIKGAKDQLKQDFIDAGHGRVIRQFSEPVISRAGEVVDIRRIPDQVFIHYADPAWTATAKEHAATMAVYPQRYADDLDNVLDWFGDRACVRRGAWLGTEYPFKEGWIVEPIADSTFYSWFYVVSLYVNDGRLQPEDLSLAFFDYVFNGIGDAKAPVWDDVRKDVLYWGPVDINLGGKEHQTVHFPVWIMNMVGLMDDPKLWPRGIYVNWWVTQKAGAKISKSKGGAEPIPGAAKKYGVDPMRLYYCHVGSPHVDIEWDPDIVLTYRQHVLRLARITEDLLGLEGAAGPMDAWLQAAVAQHLRAAKEAYETYDLRAAVTELVYGMPESLRWYQRRGGANGSLVQQVVQDWAKALCPIVPHVAEEMHCRAGGEGLASTADFPEPAGADALALAKEQYLRDVLEDIQTVKKLADVEPETLTVFTSPAWKSRLAAKAVSMAGEGKFPMGAFMQEVMADAEMRKLGKAVQQFTGKLPQQLSKLSDAQKMLLAQAVDEADVLAAASGFLAQEIGAKTAVVHAADDAPEHPKRGVAAPLKPGIAIE